LLPKRARFACGIFALGIAAPACSTQNCFRRGKGGAHLTSPPHEVCRWYRPVFGPARVSCKSDTGFAIESGARNSGVVSDSETNPSAAENARDLLNFD
jgi:hypothetical protein